MPPGYVLTDCTTWGPDVYHSDIIGCCICYETKKERWHLAEVAGLQGNPKPPSSSHILRVMDLGKPYGAHLREDNLKLSQGKTGDWYFHHHNSRKTMNHLAHNIRHSYAWRSDSSEDEE